jgi:SpoVK/Ycf46/Vps4 family AAA+-type ATPase
MTAHWGKFMDSQFFIRAEDEQALFDARMLHCHNALPYDINAFPLEALEWVERAKRFFSAEGKAKLANHNVPQQMGVVLSGPPGCGKSMFLRHIAAELSLEAEHFPPSRLIGHARRGNPLQENGLIVFDDVEELLQERQTGDSTNILPWLLVQTDARDVFVSRLLVMVTNHPEKLDDALLRPGRFDSALKFAIPTRDQMYAALRFHMATDFKEDIANAVVDKIMKLETRTLAHVSYLARIVYSGFVSSWDEALESLKQYSAYSGIKNGAKLNPRGVGFGMKTREDY